MPVIRILHTSDLHLGGPSEGRAQASLHRGRELLATFKRITELCGEEALDLLLIAGDLFDGSSVDPDLLRSVKEYLADCPARVFIAPGNHDYISLDSPFLSDDWPAQVHIFKGDLEKVDLEDKKVTVWGAAFRSSHISAPFEFTPQGLDRDRINLAVLHADLTEEGGTSLYRPLYRSALARSGMDYVALGHVHQTDQRLDREGSCSFAYSGTPDGRSFLDSGPKGVFLGELRKGNLDLDFYPTASRLFLSESLDVSDLESEKEAADFIEEKLENKFGTDWARHFYRIRLRGFFPVEKTSFWPNVQAALDDRAPFLRLVDETDPVSDYEALAKEVSLRGIFVRRMLEKIQKAAPSELDVLQRALRYGIQAFESELVIHEY